MFHNMMMSSLKAIRCTMPSHEFKMSLYHIDVQQHDDVLSHMNVVICQNITNIIGPDNINSHISSLITQQKKQK